MSDLLKPIKKKLSHAVSTLIVSGVVFLFLGILIVWTDIMLRLVMGMITIAMAYVFFYGAYRVESIKKSLDKNFKL